MKKLFLILVIMGCSFGLSAQDYVTLEQIRDNWQSKSIEVEDASPANILELVSAFHQVWPTYSGRELIKFAVSDEEYDNTDKIVDLKNGFVRYSEDDPEAESDEMLDACVWNRKNGHKLFAVTLSRMTPSELVVLCFYDYDVKANTLTPEKNLATLFTPSFPGYRYRVFLPQTGKNLVINEYFGSITIEHTYGWDGMKPVNPQITIDRLDNCQAQFNADYFGDERHPFTQYAMTDIDNDGSPELVLQSDNEEFRAVYAIALTIDLLAGENGMRFLSFYKNAVGHTGSCGALCMSGVYVILSESSPKSYLMAVSEWDEQEEDYAESSYTLNGKEISRKEGREMESALGEPYEPNLKWKELVVE